MRTIAYILAAYFLLGSLFPQTDFSQLVRLADTYAHFEEHRAEAAATDSALSVTDFLWMHFIEPNSHDAHHDHEELPLQVLNSSILDVVVLELPVVASILVLPAETARIFSATSWTPTDFWSALLRPPISA